MAAGFLEDLGGELVSAIPTNTWMIEHDQFMGAPASAGSHYQDAPVGWNRPIPEVRHAVPPTKERVVHIGLEIANRCWVSRRLGRGPGSIEPFEERFANRQRQGPVFGCRTRPGGRDRRPRSGQSSGRR